MDEVNFGSCLYEGLGIDRDCHASGKYFKYGPIVVIASDDSILAYAVTMGSVFQST
jgi:hypothetical protein